MLSTAKKNISIVILSKNCLDVFYISPVCGCQDFLAIITMSSTHYGRRCPMLSLLVNGPNISDTCRESIFKSVGNRL